MSRLAARMLDVLGHPRVDVLGVSWGGALAQQFAFQQRRRCRRLVLVSTYGGALRSDPGAVGGLLRRGDSRGLLFQQMAVLG